MKNIKFTVNMLPFLLAGSIAVTAGANAYKNRPRTFEELTDCTNIDAVAYEKYEKISYEDFKKLLGTKNREFLIEYKIVETAEENRILLDSHYILNESEYLAFHNFKRQNRNLLEAIENGEIEINGIHYVHHVAVKGNELKKFNIVDSYLTENLNDVYHITSNGKTPISGEVIFEKTKNNSITAICSYNIGTQKIKKCSTRIPASENKDQCKYDDTSILSQEDLMHPKARLQYLSSTNMTYDEIKDISSNFYIIYSDEEVTKDELIQLLKDDNKKDFYIQMLYEYGSHPYVLQRYNTTKQNYLDGKSDALKDLLQNSDIKKLKIRIHSKQIVKELPSNNKPNGSIDVIRKNYKLVCIPSGDGNYHTNIYVIDSMDITSRILNEGSMYQKRK